MCLFLYQTNGDILTNVSICLVQKYQDNKNKAVAHTAGRSGMRVCVKRK